MGAVIFGIILVTIFAIPIFYLARPAVQKFSNLKPGDIRIVSIIIAVILAPLIPFGIFLALVATGVIRGH